jgi:uncharacterized membrane protein
MQWTARYRRDVFFRSSLWAIPIGCMAAALVVAPVIRWVDDQTRWTLLGFGLDGARAVLGALVASLLTFIVFAFSLLLLAVQVASGQLTPRVIARIFEGRSLKLILSVFVLSFVYALATLGRIEDRVPQLPVLLAILLSLVSISLFLYLVQTASQSLRPVSILTRVADDTRRVIEATYPHRFSSLPADTIGSSLDPANPSRTIAYRGRSAVVLAFDIAGVVGIATRAGCAVELVPQVGDFLATGEFMFRLYGPGAAAVDEDELSLCVALGPERSLRQDPAFGFRMIVDIASKALSPAINDPTTGVLAVDQLHHLLHLLAERQLDTGIVREASGVVRLVYRTPGWEDFVTLAATEIRVYGGPNPQVTRRLQAMFERLLRVVPPERAEALRNEVALLRRTVERNFADPEDRRLALVADVQGFGSRPRTRGRLTR